MRNRTPFLAALPVVVLLAVNAGAFDFDLPPVEGAPVDLPASADDDEPGPPDPCAENKALESTRFFLMVTPPDKRSPFTSSFTFQSCTVYGGDRGVVPGAGTSQAIRTYRGNKGYDLVLATRQGRDARDTEIYLIRKLSDGGRQVSGSMGSAPTSDLLSRPIRADRYPMNIFSNGQPMEGTAELTPRKL